MKNFKLSSIAIIVSLALSSSIMTAQAKGPGARGDSSPSYGEQKTQTLDRDNSVTLSEDEEHYLLFMREEEKLARDVYLYFFDMYGEKIFQNISAAEQTHTTKVLQLLNNYNLSDPAEDTERGEFVDGDLQALYLMLISKGEQSLNDALFVGYIIEVTDIDDLNAAIEGTNKTDILHVYSQLLAGSNNHLAAFEKSLKSNDVDYQSIDLNDYLEDVYSVAGMAINSENQPVNTQTRFKNLLSTESGLRGNKLDLSENDPVKITTQINPAPKDIGQTVEYVAMVHYQGDNGENGLIMRSGESWETSNGEPQEIASAGEYTLFDTQEFHVFEGALEQMQGQFTVFVGYRLKNGDIVYNPEPMQFRVHSK
jgi:hypothetical protein